MWFIRFRGKKKINVYSYCTEYDRPTEFYIFTLFKNTKLLEKGRPNHFDKQGSSFQQQLYGAE